MYLLCIAIIPIEGGKHNQISEHIKSPYSPIKCSARHFFCATKTPKKAELIVKIVEISNPNTKPNARHI